MPTTKISVIGTGHLGSIHTKLLKQNPEADLVGIFDPDSEKAEKLSAEHGITSFASLEECIENSDAAVIAASTVYHFDIARQCIAAGRHCFIEKPITSSYEQAQELISEAAAKNVLIQVGHVERFNPSLLALKDYSLAPLFIEAHRLAQFKPRATDVSVIHDLMIHDIDIALWLVKSPVKQINAHGVAVLTETPDIANARVEFENGCVANLTASRISAQNMRKTRIFQKDAYISMDFGKGAVEVFHLVDEGQTPTEGVPAMMLGNIEAGRTQKKIFFEQPEVPQINAIMEEHRSFIAAIAHGEKIAVSAREAAEALRVAEQISAQIGFTRV